MGSRVHIIQLLCISLFLVMTACKDSTILQHNDTPPG